MALLFRVLKHMSGDLGQSNSFLSRELKYTTVHKTTPRCRAHTLFGAVIVVCSWTSRKWSHISAKSSHSSSQVPPSLDRKKTTALPQSQRSNAAVQADRFDSRSFTSILHSLHDHQLSKSTLWFITMQNMFGLLNQRWKQQISDRQFLWEYRFQCQDAVWHQGNCNAGRLRTYLVVPHYTKSIWHIQVYPRCIQGMWYPRCPKVM